MNARFDTTDLERSLQTIPIIGPDDEQMPDGIAFTPYCRQLHLGIAEAPEVLPGNISACGVPSIEIAKFHSQNGCLQTIETAAYAFPEVNIFAVPTVVGDGAGAFNERNVVTYDRTGIAERAKVLGRIEAEACDIADSPDTLAPPSRAMGLGGILYDLQPMPARD